MIGGRGYSLGPDLQWEYENRAEGWAVFNAKTNQDYPGATGLEHQYQAQKLCEEANGNPKPVPGWMQDLEE